MRRGLYMLMYALFFRYGNNVFFFARPDWDF